MKVLLWEGKTAAKWLMNVDGKAAFDVSTVTRWVSWVNGNPREKNISDTLHSGRPAAAVDENQTKQADILIKADRKSLLQNSMKALSWAMVVPAI